jgi:hypothetical protein
MALCTLENGWMERGMEKGFKNMQRIHRETFTKVFGQMILKKEKVF